ncbi:homoserine kinase [Spiractinospora alimapuensis]|uniref:homoserine kinase n=1 Tax=Spiractinospora alimapuensis TaxID=2820884 RepID=UPI001EEAEB7B|nr:homoserine kinase [Spiractinospora alimapuensis]QVQ54246.1 homoserine kinase [Spiractinospora alimapuensis]
MAAVRVRVPATSANLGPGFDTFGLALDLYDEVEARASASGRFQVEVEGEGAGEVPADESHLVVRAMLAAFESRGRQPVPAEVRCHNRIPHGRGLGSSAAAIVAGVTAGFSLLAKEGDTPDRDDVFALAADLEGHPDNVAPCVYGGFTQAWATEEGFRALRLDPSPRIRPVVCVAGERLSTERARGLLPEAVPHSDAAFNAARAGLLAAAMTGHPEVLWDATEDRLHQRYRASAMPDTAKLLDALRDDERLPAVISGAGPSVLVLTDSGAANPVNEDENFVPVVGSIRARAGTHWHVRPSTIDPVGVNVSISRS